MNRLFFIVLIFVLLAGVFSIVDKSKAIEGDINKKKAVYFYQESCAHCQAVDEYFKINGIYEKYDIQKLEISGDYNLNYFNELFDAFGIPSDKRGWPVIFFGRKFLVGDKPIQESFVNEIEKTSADNFSSPEDIKRGRVNKEDFSPKTISSNSQFSLLILLGAAIADSISPCMIVILFVLTNIIIFGNLKSKKDVFTFGSFFILSVFLVHIALGIGMFGFGKIFRLAVILNNLLGLTIIMVGFFVFEKYWRNAKAIRKVKELLKKLFSYDLKDKLEKKWEPIKKNIRRMNLVIAALVIGFVSSGFLFPCINRPYGIFANSFSEKKQIIASVLNIVLYNLIFILPVVFLFGIICWFAYTRKLEVFRKKHNDLIRIIIGVSLILVGSYFIYNSCFSLAG